MEQKEISSKCHFSFCKIQKYEKIVFYKNTIRNFVNKLSDFGKSFRIS
jgi:hypothetical protein